MREILFRGKRLDDGEWVYGGYHFEHGFGEDNEKHYITVYETHGGFAYNAFVEVDPNTVGQFTGILDKNFNKIFEGDVVIDTDGDLHEIVFGKIGFDSNWNGLTGFAFKDDYIDYADCYEIWFYNDNEELEVISNTHDNDDLYKEIKGEIK